MPPLRPCSAPTGAEEPAGPWLAGAARGRFRRGPVRLRLGRDAGPATALALALALHELATNALKHGGLSVPERRVAVACAVDPEDGAHVLEWVERGGPPVPGAPTRRGFGLRLSQRGLAAQAGMAADLRFEPEGVRCTLRLPPAR